MVRPIRRSFLDDAGGPDRRRRVARSPTWSRNFSIDKARDAAWASALTLWAVRDLGFVAAAARDALARTVGLVSRQLLVAV